MEIIGTLSTVVLFGCFGLMLYCMFTMIREIVRHSRAMKQFTASVHPRAYIERLIATTNDDADSTLRESRTMIEADAVACLPAHLAKPFISGLKQPSIGGRINYTRRMLETFYLPKSTATAVSTSAPLETPAS